MKYLGLIMRLLPASLPALGDEPMEAPPQWACVVRDGFGGKHLGYGATKDIALQTAWLICSTDMGPFVICGPGGHCRQRSGR